MSLPSGPRVRLADGRMWAFPGPAEVASGDPHVLAEVLGLLAAIGEAEDEAERLRGELALAIRLLAVDRDLTPEAYSRLLSLPPGDPGLAEMQTGFRDLARRYGEALRPAPPSPAGRPARRPWFHRVRGPARATEPVRPG